MQKIILYYKFVPILDPKAVALLQVNICKRFNLKGRIIVSTQGINVTLGGELDSLKSYLKETKKLPILQKLDVKWSNGGSHDFPKLSVKVRNEIVTFKAKSKVKVGQDGIKNGGQHIKPDHISKLIERYGDDVVFFDGRNNYESAIGNFKGAVTPNVNHSREFPKEIKKAKYKKLKGKHVVTYCTGGVRCEVLSSLLIQEGFKHVYQIKGGIVKYGETYKDKGLWQGKLFVFDNRLTTQFSDSALDIGKCHLCSTKTSNYTNCKNLSCNKLILLCSSCSGKGKVYCKTDEATALTGII